MDNYKIQQRKLMGWGEPVPFSSFLNRYDVNTILDLASRGKLQVLNPDNRVLIESELTDLLNMGFSPTASSTPDPYNPYRSGMELMTQPGSQVEELQEKLAELQGHMETIYDEMQQREADWVQKVEEMQKRFDKQLIAFQKKVDHRFASLKATAPKRNARSTNAVKDTAPKTTPKGASAPSNSQEGNSENTPE